MRQLLRKISWRHRVSLTVLVLLTFVAALMVPALQYRTVHLTDLVLLCGALVLFWQDEYLRLRKIWLHRRHTARRK